MSAPLTRKDLDAETCSRPGCDHTAHTGLVLHARCHLQAPLEVEYRRGVLRLRCSRCAQLVSEIAVAP